MLDPMMYVSPRAQLDPDSGCVEFFARFDVDNNGYFDLVCADDSGPFLRLYFGSSSGYSPNNRRLFPVPGGGNIDLADLNLDGRAELVHSGWRSGHVTIYWGSDSGPSPGDTTWLTISGQSEAVAIYDLDRDSYLDILAGSDNGMLYIFWGSSAGYSSANRSSVFLNGSIGHNLEVADLDQDGYGDIVASLWSRNQAAVIYWGAGRTPKSIAWLPVSPNNPHGVSVADLNLDNWLDVVLTGYDTVTSAFIYYGSENGFSTSNREIIHPGQCYGGSAVVAWNADKTLDLIFFRGDWGRTNTYRPRVFFNRLDTTPHFSDSRSSEIGELAFNASGGFVADLNYDGYQDLFVNNMLPDSASYVLWGPYYITSTALPADRDHHGVWREPGNIYTRAFNAIYVSSVHDMGQDTVIESGTCSWVANEPLGSSVGIEVRAGNTSSPDSTWTDFLPVPTNGGPLPEPIEGKRFLQYRADFSYTRPCYLPQLERVSFELNPTPAVDVGVSRILAPTGDIDSGSVVTPRVEVRNYHSSTPVASVTLRIGTGWISTVTDTLAPSGTDTVAFPNWTATIPGIHAVRCSVYAALDENPANDTLSTTVRVVVGSDVGPTQIVAPPVSAESGSVHVPQVVVTNFGTRSETFPVHLWIGTSYHETVTDTLGPGQSGTVTFPSWVAAQVGPQVVRCFTALTRDEHPENDTLSRITYVWTRIDAATVAILAPTDTVDSGTVVTPRARVANLGGNSADIPVRMQIGDGYADTVTVAVAAGETATVTFSDWVATPLGIQPVRCSTMLAGDTINGNDLKTDSVTVIAHRDAYAVAILAPSGAVDSGTVITPICRIGNNGTSPALIPARLRIGTGYSQTRSKLVNPGQTDTLHFPDWVASPLGLIPVQCSTALAGDEQPANDTVSTNVLVGVRIDAAARAVLAPMGTIDSGTVVAPVCSVANLGARQELIPVYLRIGAGYAETRTKLLTPGAEDTVGFPAWTATPLGTFTVTCSTGLAGDTFPVNDTVRTTVQVVAAVDAELTAILTPAGTVDSGALVIPSVTVTNLGTRTENIPVRLTITGGYADTVTVTVAPEETTVVIFSDWIAQPVGLLAVRCSTALTGDENPANDTANGWVQVTTVIDAATVAILAPTDTVDSGTVVTPRARVANLGGNSADIPVRMQIGDGYADTVTVAVAAGETATVTFSDWVATPLGIQPVRCSTMLAGDTINGNDLKTDSVTVIAHRDAYAVAILAPSGAVDSGTVITPICRIGNNGTSPALIPARLRIGTGYSQTRSKLVNPGQTDTLHFPDWVASPLGLIPVQCSTALAGDEQPANDTVSTNVLVGVRIDAAARAVLAPMGTIDSGTVVAPVCSVANLGARQELIPVYLRIGAGYAETRTKLLTPGAEDTVGFPAWTATPLGTFTVTCSTGLAGDTFPVNDTVRTTVQVVAAVDAELTAILTPAGTVDSGALVIPSVTVTNLGTRTENIPVRMTIGTGYSNQNAIILAPGETDTLYFAEWTAQPVGTHQVVANTYLTGDRDPSNDTARGLVTVGRRIDAGVTAIIAPVGDVDSGAVVTPVCRIVNNGTSAALVPVMMRITNGYQQSRTKLVPAGVQDTVQFPDWLASPVGGFAVRCSTYLAGDTFYANDTLSDSVRVIPYIDAAAVDIVAPSGVLDSGTVVTPVARIANLGSEPVAIPTWLRIGPGYMALRSKVVAPGVSDTVQFPDWIATPLGTHPVRCSTALAGDRHPENDTVSASIEVRLRVDAEAVAIIRPTGTVDSGTTVVPLVRVGNNSSRTQTIPVRLEIGTGYTQSANIVLAPGVQDTVQFPNWTASVPGPQLVRCSTALSGDQHPDNDTVSAWVNVYRRIDAGVAAILAPTGVVDSGTVVAPRAIVPTRFNIGGGYADSLILDLEPGQSDTAQFTDWVAAPLGWQTVECSTALAGDTSPANDRLTDSVLVTAGVDAAVVTIIAPTGTVDSGTVVIPVCQIANYSTSPKVVPVRLAIGTSYSDTAFKWLGAGQSDTVRFANWIATPLGMTVVRCSTYLAGDTNPVNDTTSTTVEVTVRVNAATVAILAPTGTVDSGAVITPVGRIANYSTSPKTVPVNFRIGAGYAQSRLKFLAPSQVDTVTFPDWIATPVGTHAVVCSTALAQDQNPDDDRLVDSVTVVSEIDAAVLSIIAPTGVVDSGARIVPQAVVANYGSSAADIPVRFRISSGYADVETVHVEADSLVTVEFSAWTAEPVGMVAVSCSTELAGDIRPENDAVRDSVLVQAVVDAAPTLILSPSGIVDSGTIVVPSVTVANHSSHSQLVPVQLGIGADYSDIEVVMLAPEQRDTVQFLPWVATPPGLSVVRCSTALTGDQHPENDTLSSVVLVSRRIDAAAIRVVAPTGVIDSGTVVTPQALIANLGTSRTFVPIHMFIGTNYGDTVLVNLAPGESAVIRFDDWVGQPVGMVAVRCTTALPGDTNNANDRAVDSVLVTVDIDAAALAIVAPTGTVDSGKVVTPVCRIANYSTSPKLIPVKLSIGSTYSESTSKFLAPGSDDTVHFIDWVASELGVFAVRCVTRLEGDQHPENDTVVDSVRVVARVDAGVTTILVPTGTVDSGAVVVPCARVVNNSVSPKLVPVSMTIGSFYTAARDKFLLPGQEDTVTFVEWEASQLGTHPVRCSTALAGDEDPSNDTLGTAVVVRVRIDAAALAILAPVGVVDSGTTVTPQAVVTNYGMRPESVPVHFRIGAAYHESTTVVLEPESSQVVDFPDWTASAVGMFRVSCATALTGDENPENDTVVDSVRVVNRHDMSCYLVLAPTGTVDSGTVVTPRAMVTNCGLGTEYSPVWCFIGTDYADMRFVTVGPGESLMVAFREWVATPVGVLPVRCSTALIEDTTNGNDMAQDSVRVVTHPDAAVTDIYAPLGIVDSGTVVVPWARICNYGTTPALVPVRMRIGAGYDELRRKFLDVGGKDTVGFPDWVATPLGTYVVSCSTELAGDERPENDRKSDSVRVVSFCDAALIAILAPPPLVDSGTVVAPRAVVANYGTSAAAVPVRMRITPDYDSTAIVMIAAGATDTVVFPDWLATPVGTQAVRCSTALPGDHHNGNDFLNSSVTVTVDRDAACLEIQEPKECIDSGRVVAPQVVIQNRSTSPTEIPLFVRIGQDYFKSRRKLLASGQSDTVVFPVWQAHPAGIVAVACSVALAGDQYVKNNAIHESVYVAHYLDGGVSAILAPLGTVPLGHEVVPKARIVNLGMATLAIPVQMRIGDCYRSVRSKVIAAGAMDTVHFAVWNAASAGHQAVRCTTLLAGDNNPANDFQDASVDVVWRDAGCIRVLAPVGTIPAQDTVVPQAVVRNFGTGPVRIPAVFRFGPLYAQLVYTDSLAPGDSAVLAFPPLVISPGQQTASCSTALPMDMNLVNDKCTVTVFGATRAIVLEPDSMATAPPAGIVNYHLTCYNNGNCGDTIDITHLGTRPGWQVQFFDSSGTIELSDHNGNSIPDLGPVPAQGKSRFVGRVTVPVEELGLVTDSTQVQATSGADTTVWDRARCFTTVKAVADLLMEPPLLLKTTAAGNPIDYVFTITNLGNIEDYADLSWWATNGGWRHEFSDGTGKGLPDRNNNGRKDIGPIAPNAGTVELVLRITPDRRARPGQRDTCFVTVRSFVDEQVGDDALAVTLVTGAVTALAVEPDQSGAVPVGDSAVFGLWVETAGSLQDVVNLRVACSRPDWQTVLLDETGQEELRDTDFDNCPDLGGVWPGTRARFNVRVRTPSSAQLVECIDSLAAVVTVTGFLSGDPSLRDSAVLRLVAVPRFEVHITKNPFSEQTRFVFSTPNRGRVSLLVYNRLGELVRRLIDNESYTPGIYSLDWDGTNQQGRRLAPGTYLYLFEVRPETGPVHREIKKVVING